MDQEFDGSYDIWGGDIDPRAVAIAQSNAEKAGVADLVRFDVADVSTLTCQGDYGQIVTNPPYGERLLEKKEAEELYRALGKVPVPPKWRTVVITSDADFERHFGRRAGKKRKLYNGMLLCAAYMYP